MDINLAFEPFSTEITNSGINSKLETHKFQSGGNTTGLRMSVRPVSSKLINTDMMKNKPTPPRQETEQQHRPPPPPHRHRPPPPNHHHRPPHRHRPPPPHHHHRPPPRIDPFWRRPVNFINTYSERVFPFYPTTIVYPQKNVIHTVEKRGSNFDYWIIIAIIIILISFIWKSM